MTRAEQLEHLAWALRQRGGIRAALTWKPFSLTGFRILLALERQGLDFGTIVDGGSNIGQFARAATETYPRARVICFEPLPDVAETLRANLADRPQVRVVTSALDRREGRVRLHRTAYSLASSVLEVLPEWQAELEGFREEEVLDVPATTLDAALADEPLEPPVLLKLDLQGYEITALRGGRETLRRTDHVLLEVGFSPQYRDEPLFEEVRAFMRDAGWCFLRPIDVLADGKGKIYQMDALFTRSG